MSDDSPAVVLLLERRRALEVQQATITARIAEVDECLSLLRDGRRRPNRKPRPTEAPLLAEQEPTEAAA